MASLMVWGEQNYRQAKRARLPSSSTVLKSYCFLTSACENICYRSRPPRAQPSPLPFMNSASPSIVIIPGVVALLLCLLFTYLYQQSRQVYFRAWQIAWACYSIYYALDAFHYYRPPAHAALFFGSLFSMAMGVSIFVSTRLTRGSLRFRWYDWALALAGTAAACIDLRSSLLETAP